MRCDRPGSVARPGQIRRDDAADLIALQSLADPLRLPAPKLIKRNVDVPLHPPLRVVIRLPMSNEKEPHVLPLGCITNSICNGEPSKLSLARSRLQIAIPAHQPRKYRAMIGSGAALDPRRHSAEIDRVPDEIDPGERRQRHPRHPVIESPHPARSEREGRALSRSGSE